MVVVRRRSPRNASVASRLRARHRGVAGDVGREEQSPVRLQRPHQIGGERRREEAPGGVGALRPRIREVDVIRGHRRRRNDGSRSGSARRPAGCARSARALRDPLGEPARLRRRALDAEQAARRNGGRAAPSETHRRRCRSRSRPGRLGRRPRARTPARPSPHEAGRGHLPARQTERTFADDVALHLRGAAADREGARGEDATQPLARLVGRAAGTLDQPSGPSRSSAKRMMRRLSSVPKSFATDASGPGSPRAPRVT